MCISGEKRSRQAEGQQSKASMRIPAAGEEMQYELQVYKYHETTRRLPLRRGGGTNSQESCSHC